VAGYLDYVLEPTETPTPWGRVHALTCGEPSLGDLVVVPGLGVSAYLRASVEHAAVSGYRTWLPDPPGFGHSGDPTRALGIPDIATVVEHWLRERELGPVTLVGHSCGTQIAAHVAARAPDLVERLLLGSPTIDPRYRSWPKALARWRRDGQLEPRSLTRSQVPEWRRAGPFRLLHLFRSMLADNLDRTLARVTCPVTVVRGARDPLCTSAWARRLGDEYLEVDGLPHAFPYQAPEVWVDSLVRL
jgi:pimeloyl-ACP methyl ester carboxylesterase